MASERLRENDSSQQDARDDAWVESPTHSERALPTSSPNSKRALLKSPLKSKRALLKSPANRKRALLTDARDDARGRQRRGGGGARFAGDGRDALREKSNTSPIGEWDDDAAGVGGGEWGTGEQLVQVRCNAGKEFLTRRESLTRELLVKKVF